MDDQLRDEQHARECRELVNISRKFTDIIHNLPSVVSSESVGETSKIAELFSHTLTAFIERHYGSPDLDIRVYTYDEIMSGEMDHNGPVSYDNE